MRSFIEFGIVAGIVTAVAAALNGCAQKQASLTPVASQSHASHHRASQTGVNHDQAGQGKASRADRSGSRASLAAYQTAPSGGAQEQSESTGDDRSMQSTESAAPSAPTPQSPRSRSSIDADSNGIDQPLESDQDDDNRGLRTRQSRRPYTSPSFSRDYAQGLLASATPSGGYINPQLGREAAEASLIAASNVSGERGLAASQPTARQTVTGPRGLQDGPLVAFTPASPNNILTLQANPRSGPNGACAQLTRNGLGNNQICNTNVNRSISGRNFRFTIRRGIRR